MARVKDGNTKGRPNDRSQQSERLDVHSGELAIIDQFMLANEQFWSLLKDSSVSSRDALMRYGGSLVAVENGSYRVLREARESLIALIPENLLGDGNGESIDEDISINEFIGGRMPENAKERVFIDTRCMVFVDASFLESADKLSEYRELRVAKKDKKARDFLRSNGASVRYGFSKQGDELAVGLMEQEGIVVLWPDVVN